MSTEGKSVFREIPCAVSLSASLRRLVVLVIVAVTLLFTAGCKTCHVGKGRLSNDREWGQDAWRPVNLARLRKAAWEAFKSPNTLIPLAGVVLFEIDDFDERASDWAVKHNPIFGSEEGADDASDFLKAALGVEAAVMAFVTPSGDKRGTGEWWGSKARGLTVEGVALAATVETTELAKSNVHRTRPDKSDDRSFFSGHTSTSFSFATLANRNLDSIEMPPFVRNVRKGTNIALASAVGWARVEAKKHYPTDVLVGAAVGHFLTAFIHDAFMNLPEEAKAEQRRFDFAIVPTDGGAAVILAWQF